MAMPRRSTGNTWAIMTIDSGMMMPDTAPCTSRARNRISPVFASPPRMEDTANSTMLKRKVAAMPKARMAHAVISIVTVPAARCALTRFCAWSMVRPRAPMMSGMATLMMVAVRSVAKEPSTATPVTQYG